MNASLIRGVSPSWLTLFVHVGLIATDLTI
jgi:hypothetical protein